MAKLIWRFDELLMEKEARDKRRYTNADLAAIFDIDTVTAWRWRKGANFENLSATRLAEIAEWLDVSIDDLLGRESA